MNDLSVLRHDSDRHGRLRAAFSPCRTSLRSQRVWARAEEATRRADARDGGATRCRRGRRRAADAQRSLPRRLRRVSFQPHASRRRRRVLTRRRGRVTVSARACARSVGSDRMDRSGRRVRRCLRGVPGQPARPRERRLPRGRRRQSRRPLRHHRQGASPVGAFPSEWSDSPIGAPISHGASQAFPRRSFAGFATSTRKPARSCRSSARTRRRRTSSTISSTTRPWTRS